MSITCNKILKLPYASKLKVVAGKEGLDNIVRWVHYLEDPQYVEWLKGGELVIISGVVTHDNSTKIIQLINMLYDKNVAGVVINLSRYIKNISAEVIREGNALNLPIFEMPEQMRIVDISQSICYAIFQERNRETAYSNILLEIIYGRRMTERRMNKLEQYNLVSGKKLCAVAVKYSVLKTTEEETEIFYSEKMDEKTDRIIDSMAQFFYQKGVQILHAKYDDMIVSIIEDGGKSKITAFLTEMCDYIEKTNKDVRVYAAVGRVFDQLGEIRDSLETAMMLFDLEYECQTDRILFYHDFAIEQIFYNIHDLALLESIQANILGELLAEKNRELLENLKVYFKHNRSISDTAAALYVHTNTMKYRIKKIEGMIGKDFHSTEDCFYVNLALKISRYLDKKNQ